jgi:ABC-2 type transport system permease protein
MKILDIALKDLLRSFRSVFAVGMMFVAPLLITGLMYFAFGGLNAGTGSFNLPPLKVALVNLDRPESAEFQFGQMLVDFFQDENMPGWLQSTELDSEASARAAINRQEAGVAVIIPTDFTALLLGGEKTAMLILIQDPTLSTGPQIVKDILTQFVDGVSGTRIALTIAGETSTDRGSALAPASIGAIVQAYSDWYTALSKNLHHSETPILAIQAPSSAQDQETSGNPIQKMIGLIMAGQMIFFAFFTGATTAQSILREDEEGTLPRLFTTPTPRSVILAGKFVAVFFTIAVQAAVLIFVSGLLFRIDWGQPLSLVLATFGLVVVAAGFGIFAVSFVKNNRQAGVVMGGLLAVTGMLGGLFTTNISMPKAFNTLNLFFPQGWVLRGWKLVLSGGSLVEVLLPVAMMLVIGAALFAAGVVIFKKRYA